jgi:hypothetical protein
VQLKHLVVVLLEIPPPFCRPKFSLYNGLFSVVFKSKIIRWEVGIVLKTPDFPIQYPVLYLLLKGDTTGTIGCPGTRANRIVCGDLVGES